MYRIILKGGGGGWGWGGLLSACSPPIENPVPVFRTMHATFTLLTPSWTVNPDNEDLHFFTSWNLNEATLRKLSEKLQLTHYIVFLVKNVDFLVDYCTVAELGTPEIANLFPAAVSLLLGVLQPRWPLATVCSSSDGKFGPWLVQVEDLSSSKESSVPASTRKQTRWAMQYEFVTTPDLEASAIFPFSVYTND